MQGARKGKVALVVIASVLAVVLVIGGIVVVRHESMRRQIRDVVYSKEADKVYRKEIKAFDPKALTEQGVIRSYKIDENSIKRDPMGGIDVTLIINSDSSLTLDLVLNRDNEAGVLESGGSGISGELGDILDKQYPNLNK